MEVSNSYKFGNNLRTTVSKKTFWGGGGEQLQKHPVYPYPYLLGNNEKNKCLWDDGDEDLEKVMFSPYSRI